MAGRQFNRLRKQLDEDLPPPPAVEDSGSDEDDVAKPAPFNPFDLLTEDEGAADQAEEQDDDDEDEHSQPESHADAAPKPSGSKKKKQRKKKKGKAAAAEAHTPDAAHQEQESKAEEDIDHILQELNIKVAVHSSSSSTSAALSSGGNSGAGVSGRGQDRPLLGVEVRNLKAEDELRRMFGAKVVEAEGEDTGDAFAGASRRVRRLAARGLIQRVQLKKGLIITPRDIWPQFEGGVTMEYKGITPEGKLEFTYVRSQAYQAVQELYEQCEASFDPNNVAALLQSHPYHLDALLTMHDLYRSMGENAYADEMLERCVYALEMAWHPSFNPAAGNMFVPFDDINMPLFLALFKYQQGLSRRGLHRTALEICKLLLALNPHDPMGALFAIDYLAVRAERYDFLQRLAQQYGDGDQAVQLLPNIAYSLALARWHQEQDQASGKRAKGSSSGGSGGSRASGSRTSTQQKEEEQQPQGAGDGEADRELPSEAGEGREKSSAELLTKAVLMHPLVVPRLLKKVQEKGTGKDADWTYLLSQPLLRDADDGGSASLSHLTDLFVERQHLLWKAQPIQELLKAACRLAISGDGLPDGTTQADWACVREQAFPHSDENLYRHLRLYDFSDTVQRIPPDDIHGIHPGGGGGGGGAGMRHEDLAAIEAELRQLEARVQAEGGVPEEYLRDGNPLVVLLRSFMPWFNPGQQPNYEQDDGNEQQ